LTIVRSLFSPTGEPLTVTGPIRLAFVLMSYWHIPIGPIRPVRPRPRLNTAKVIIKAMIDVKNYFVYLVHWPTWLLSVTIVLLHRASADI
jgi:hypothetical protein